MEWEGDEGNEPVPVLATVLDCDFRFVSGSEPNRRQIGAPGCQ
jgi:hypothetical protein